MATTGSATRKVRDTEVLIKTDHALLTGKLEQVAALAAKWFLEHMPPDKE